MTSCSPSFLAIDFELANPNPRSACALAIVHVENGGVVARELTLINPGPVRFDFTAIHGITARTVADAPPFDVVWKTIAGSFVSAPFIGAHNAKFDRGVLQALARKHHIRLPRLHFRCSMNLAQAIWGCQPSDLASVAAMLGIPLRHHDPLSDAEACARIILAAELERAVRQSRPSRDEIAQ